MSTFSTLSTFCPFIRSPWTTLATGKHCEVRNLLSIRASVPSPLNWPLIHFADSLTGSSPCPQVSLLVLFCTRPFHPLMLHRLSAAHSLPSLLFIALLPTHCSFSSPALKIRSFIFPVLLCEQGGRSRMTKTADLCTRNSLPGPPSPPSLLIPLEVSESHRHFLNLPDRPKPLTCTLTPLQLPQMSFYNDF